MSLRVVASAPLTGAEKIKHARRMAHRHAKLARDYSIACGLMLVMAHRERAGGLAKWAESNCDLTPEAVNAFIAALRKKTDKASDRAALAAALEFGGPRVGSQIELDPDELFAYMRERGLLDSSSCPRESA